jgi:anion-transporting  ArsA/GET3 family ATPase
LIVTVASFKGGQAKTTTAVHLAALLNEQNPTLLVDGDPNRSATSWNKRKGFPFKVVDEKQAVRFAKEFEHVVIDTQWPAVRFKDKRAITLEEYQQIIAAEVNPERKTLY